MRLTVSNVAVGVLVCATITFSYLMMNDGSFPNRSAKRDSLGEFAVANDLAAARSETTVGMDGQVDSAVQSTTAKGVEAKLNQRAINARNNTGLTDQELRTITDEVFAAYYSPKSSAEFLAEVHAQLVDTLGVEEADFRFAVINAGGDWEEINRLVDERETLLGDSSYYDALLLETGINSGMISADEVVALVNAGNALPDDTIFRMASQGNVEAIKGLANRGLLGNPNYEHPTLSMNAIGAFIRFASSYPDQFDPESAENALSTLISIGIETQPTSGSLDPLDFALQSVHTGNASVKLAMVKVLIQNGARVEQSHMDALSQMRSGQIKVELETLLANNF